MKFGERLFQTKLVSRLSHKVCRLLSSPVLLRKFTIVLIGTHKNATHVYRRILVYTFCLINIRFSSSDEANKITPLNIEKKTTLVISVNLSPGKFSLKNAKIWEECISSLMVFPPSNFAVFDCCYFVCYWLQRAEFETCTNCSHWPAFNFWT